MMGILFRPWLIERIKAGVKTQTRRLPGKGTSVFRPGEADAVESGDADAIADNPPPGVSKTSSRNADMYAMDRQQDVDRLVAEVFRWCREWGRNRRIRIALCGYAGEHDGLELPENGGWTCVPWKAQGGYGNRRVKRGEPNVNRGRERIWFSPACIAAKQGELF